MSSEPWIGDENDRGSACGFGLDEFDPSKGHCPERATVHIWSESAIHGEVSLSTCGRHAPLARAAGRFLGEHPFGEGCQAHSTWFRADGCVPSETSGAAS